MIASSPVDSTVPGGVVGSSFLLVGGGRNRGVGNVFGPAGPRNIPDPFGSTPLARPLPFGSTPLAPLRHVPLRQGGPQLLMHSFVAVRSRRHGRANSPFLR